MDKEWLLECTFNHMRRQRHDFMNYLQVIYGYLQINKPSEAIDYIKHINSTMTMLSEIANLNSTIISVLLYELVFESSKFGIEVVFFNELEYIYDQNFSKDIDRIKNIFENASIMLLNRIKIMSENDNKKLYIKVHGPFGCVRITMSNSLEFISEIEEKENGDFEKKAMEGINEDNGFTSAEKNKSLAVILYL